MRIAAQFYFKSEFPSYTRHRIAEVWPVTLAADMEEVRWKPDSVAVASADVRATRSGRLSLAQPPNVTIELTNLPLWTT
jgi:hypothetical protein